MDECSELHEVGGYICNGQLSNGSAIGSSHYLVMVLFPSLRDVCSASRSCISWHGWTTTSSACSIIPTPARSKVTPSSHCQAQVNEQKSSPRKELNLARTFSIFQKLIFAKPSIGTAQKLRNNNPNRLTISCNKEGQPIQICHHGWRAGSDIEPTTLAITLARQRVGIGCQD